jgi:hypothetical protein
MGKFPPSEGKLVNIRLCLGINKIAHIVTNIDKDIQSYTWRVKGKLCYEHLTVNIGIMSFLVLKKSI